MTDVVSPPALYAGPAAPTARALAALHPLRPDRVVLQPHGLLGAWQKRNRAATLPHCLTQLEQAGSLDNLRRVTGASRGRYRGMWFQDSDVYKTLEAVAWEIGRRPVAETAELRAFLDSTVDLLDAAQDGDGYLNSYFQVDHRDRQWRELRGSHELYCAGHLIQAAVAAVRAGVGDRLMAVARRFADLLVTRFGPGGQDAVCGHPEIETALVELYRVTGHAPYLDLARRFVDLRGHGLLGVDGMGPQYYQDHAPVRAATEVTGHAVRQLYLLAGAVDVAVEAHDRELLAATERLWDSAFGTRTYLTGGHGSRHRDEAFGDPYELPPDRAYAETCAAIASFQWNWRMLLATGGHRYADEMERVLYNAVAVSTALDGRHFFYANPLHLRAGHDGSIEDAPSRRLAWYTCACCPPNLARLLASLQSYVATGNGDGVQLHLYGAGTIHSGQHVLDVSTRYPWDGWVAVTVRSAGPGPWTLALRVPAWCTAYTLRVDGVAVEVEPRDGYLRLVREWTPGTTVVLALDMAPRLVSAHPHVDAVRGCLALVRGPLVYCLEQADLPDGVPLQDVRLNAGAPIVAAETGGHTPIPVVLTAEGVAVSASDPALYRDGGAVAGTPATVPLTAIPYFLWGNRAPGPMRVWIPVDTTATVPSP
ncbi:MAG TPA: beta-L-arabinofuranosidase domain-containing protein [Rugosimonospora sp.]|nr:beta-L-arabinofuranosidase domain-containing protein [Rugosimonospora sp.]